ncbi:hypothetical protein IWW38_004658, partial [Coemansia aciculifera]
MLPSLTKRSCNDGEQVSTGVKRTYKSAEKDYAEDKVDIVLAEAAYDKAYKTALKRKNRTQTRVSEPKQVQAQAVAEN